MSTDDDTPPSRRPLRAHPSVQGRLVDGENTVLLVKFSDKESVEVRVLKALFGSGKRWTECKDPSKTSMSYANVDLATTGLTLEELNRGFDALRWRLSIYSDVYVMPLAGGNQVEVGMPTDEVAKATKSALAMLKYATPGQGRQ